MRGLPGPQLEDPGFQLIDGLQALIQLDGPGLCPDLGLPVTCPVHLSERRGGFAACVLEAPAEPGGGLRFLCRGFPCRFLLLHGFFEGLLRLSGPPPEVLAAALVLLRLIPVTAGLLQAGSDLLGPCLDLECRVELLPAPGQFLFRAGQFPLGVLAVLFQTRDLVHP